MTVLDYQLSVIPVHLRINPTPRKVIDHPQVIVIVPVNVSYPIRHRLADAEQV